MLNKQKDLLIAIPLTILVGVVFGVSVIQFLTVARLVRSDDVTYGHAAPTQGMHAQLPLPEIFPVRKEVSSDFQSKASHNTKITPKIT